MREKKKKNSKGENFSKSDQFPILIMTQYNSVPWYIDRSWKSTPWIFGICKSISCSKLNQLGIAIWIIVEQNKSEGATEQEWGDKIFLDFAESFTWFLKNKLGWRLF